MVMNDPIGDLLARIRNAQMRKRNEVITPASKLRAWVLDVLQSEGFIKGYKSIESDNGKIISSKITSVSYNKQKKLTKEIKKAKILVLL